MHTIKKSEIRHGAGSEAFFTHMSMPVVGALVLAIVVPLFLDPIPVFQVVWPILALGLISFPALYVFGYLSKGRHRKWLRKQIQSEENKSVFATVGLARAKFHHSQPITEHIQAWKQLAKKTKVLETDTSRQNLRELAEAMISSLRQSVYGDPLFGRLDPNKKATIESIVQQGIVAIERHRDEILENFLPQTGAPMRQAADAEIDTLAAELDERLSSAVEALYIDMAETAEKRLIGLVQAQADYGLY